MSCHWPPLRLATRSTSPESQAARSPWAAFSCRVLLWCKPVFPLPVHAGTQSKRPISQARGQVLRSGASFRPSTRFWGVGPALANALWGQLGAMNRLLHHLTNTPTSQVTKYCSRNLAPQLRGVGYAPTRTRKQRARAALARPTRYAHTRNTRFHALRAFTRFCEVALALRGLLPGAASALRQKAGNA
jgi:hypothetical protein